MFFRTVRPLTPRLGWVLGVPFQLGLGHESGFRRVCSCVFCASGHQKNGLQTPRHPPEGVERRLQQPRQPPEGVERRLQQPRHPLAGWEDVRSAPRAARHFALTPPEHRRPRGHAPEIAEIKRKTRKTSGLGDFLTLYKTARSKARVLFIVFRSICVISGARRGVCTL